MVMRTVLFDDGGDQRAMLAVERIEKIGQLVVVVGHTAQALQKRVGRANGLLVRRPMDTRMRIEESTHFRKWMVTCFPFARSTRDVHRISNGDNRTATY